MAERQLPIREAVVIDNDGEEINGEPISDEETAYLNFRESLKAGENLATIRVSRIKQSAITGHPTNAPSVYCFACSIDQYDYEGLIEFIRDNYGGGHYRLIGSIKGRKGTAFNRLVEIAEPLKKAPENTQPSGSPGAIIDTVSNLINASMERTEALMTRVIAARDPNAGRPPVDPIDQLAKLLTAFAPIMGAARAPSDGGFLVELEKLSKLRGLLSDFNGDGDGGGERAETNAFDLIGKSLDTFAPAIMSAVQQNRQPKRIAPNARPVIESTATPAQPVPEIATPQPPPQANTMQALKPQIDALVRNAKKGVDATAMAGSVIDMTPEENLPQLLAFVGAPDSIDRMAGVSPEVALYREWFETLRKAVVDELTPATTASNNPPAT